MSRFPGDAAGSSLAPSWTPRTEPDPTPPPIRSRAGHLGHHPLAPPRNPDPTLRGAPMATYYETLLEERDTLSGSIEQTVTKAQDNGGLGDDDKTQITRMQKRVADIDGELTILATEQDSLRKANDFAARFLRSPKPAPAEQRSPVMESVGSAFVGSAEFREYDFRGKTHRFEFTEPD